MKTLFDTSIIVSGIVESHPMHAKCLPWLQRAKAGDVECIVASHTLAETYAVLTTLPVKPRISPLVAQRLIDNNLQAIARIVPEGDYRCGLVRRRRSWARGPVESLRSSTMQRRFILPKNLPFLLEFSLLHTYVRGVKSS
jgi:hypothetical protein